MAQRTDISPRNPGVILAGVFFILLTLVFLTWVQTPFKGMALMG